MDGPQTSYMASFLEDFPGGPPGLSGAAPPRAALTPSVEEVAFLEALNAARADPPAYGRQIGLNLAGAAPSPPLGMDGRLVASARGHSDDMEGRGYFSHTGSDGTGPGQRMAAQGVGGQAWAESIAAGHGDPAATLKQLIVDQGVPGQGHRRMLLAMGSPYDRLTAVGVGYAHGGPYGDYWTVDAAAVQAQPPGGGNLPPPPPPPPPPPGGGNPPPSGHVPRPRWWPRWAPWPFELPEGLTADADPPFEEGVRAVHQPAASLLAQTVIDAGELKHFLASEGIDWKLSDHGASAVVEVAGRLCYMSFDKPRPGGREAYLANILEQRHGSVLEHAVFSVVLSGVDRNTTHEIVRHRTKSYSQLSSRFTDSATMGFCVSPLIASDPELYRAWKAAAALCKAVYEAADARLYENLSAQHRGHGDDRLPKEFERKLRKQAREAARDILPGCLETKIYITANARSWRNFFELRCASDAALQARRAANAVFHRLHQAAPDLFGDYTRVNLPDGTFAVSTMHRKV